MKFVPCKLIGLLTLLGLSTIPSQAAVKRGDVIYRSSFSDPAGLTGWQGVDTSSMTLIATPLGSKALHLTATVDGAHNMATTMPLDIAKLRGTRVVVSAVINATDIVKTDHPWHGVKFVLEVHTPGGTQTNQPQDLPGDFVWREVRYGAEIPENATSANLILGSEKTSGTVDFDDVRVTTLEAPRPPSTKPIAGPMYTGHTAPQLRGVMIADTLDAPGAEKLAQIWKANVVRFQVGFQRGGAAPETDMGPSYDAHLEKELVRLDQFLPIAKQNGLLVVIDMHAPPGGRISPWIGDRIFEDIRYQDKLAQAWETISKRYVGNPTVWGFDLCNEPLERTTRDNIPGWQELATRLAKIVRHNDAKHTIIVESMNSDAENFRYLTPIPVKGIVYSSHIYTPYDYTMQGISGSGVSPTWQPVSYPGMIGGKLWNKEKLAEVVKPIADFQKQCNAAIYIGEFSAVRWAPNSGQWLGDLIDLFEANHWDWTYHAYREWKGWDAEYPADHDINVRSETQTPREALLMSYFSRNELPTTAAR